MSTRVSSAATPVQSADTSDSANLLLGTGLVFASLILVPAFAARFGLGSSLTGALRIALMRASARAIGNRPEGDEAAPACFSCH